MKKEKVIIPNKKRLEEKINKMAEDGIDNLHVLSDFDKTFTKAFSRGKKIATLISVLRSEKYLTPDYPAKAYALFDKYHPIEINPKINIQIKKRKMQEWWMTHLKLLIKSGLNKNDIKRAVSSRKINLRKKVPELIDILNKHKIPLVIMSSSGLGAESISLYFKTKKISQKNIYIISNNFIWDKKGKAVGFEKPIIHAMNKDETAIHKFPIYKKIKQRKNVLLLGDSLDDVGMAEGFEYENVIKIGFLNEAKKENLRIFKKYFDMVILNDGSFKEINRLLNKIITNGNSNKKLQKNSWRKNNTRNKK